MSWPFVVNRVVFDDPPAAKEWNIPPAAHAIRIASQWCEAMDKAILSLQPAAAIPGVESTYDNARALLSPDLLRHQSVAVMRACVDALHRAEPIPSALLWKLDLSREPEAHRERARIIGERMKARGSNYSIRPPRGIPISP